MKTENVQMLACNSSMLLSLQNVLLRNRLGSVLHLHGSVLEGAILNPSKAAFSLRSSDLTSSLGDRRGAEQHIYEHVRCQYIMHAVLLKTFFKGT